MKISHLPIFALLLAGLLLDGCCGLVKCDCFPSGLYISYQDSTQQCDRLFDSDLVIETYSVAGDVLLEEEAFQQNIVGDGCTVFLFPKIEHYYVIHSDSIGVNDTLRIKALEITDRKNGCCYCGPRIRSVEYEINGQTFDKTDAVRNY